MKSFDTIHSQNQIFIANKSLVNKNNNVSLWPFLLDCLYTGTALNEMNKVGQGWAWARLVGRN